MKKYIMFTAILFFVFTLFVGFFVITSRGGLDLSKYNPILYVQEKSYQKEEKELIAKLEEMEKKSIEDLEIPLDAEPVEIIYLMNKPYPIYDWSYFTEEEIALIRAAQQEPFGAVPILPEDEFDEFNTVQNIIDKYDNGDVVKTFAIRSINLEDIGTSTFKSIEDGFALHTQLTLDPLTEEAIFDDDYVPDESELFIPSYYVWLKGSTTDTNEEVLLNLGPMWAKSHDTVEHLTVISEELAEIDFTEVTITKEPVPVETDELDQSNIVATNK